MLSWVVTEVLRTTPPDTTDEVWVSLGFFTGIAEADGTDSLFLSPVHKEKKTYYNIYLTSPFGAYEQNKNNWDKSYKVKSYKWISL